MQAMLGISASLRLPVPFSGFFPAGWVCSGFATPMRITRMMAPPWHKHFHRLEADRVPEPPVNGTLILVAGVPGVGKTTFAKKLAKERRAIRYCPDEWIEAILPSPDAKAERDRLRDPIENLQWDLAREQLAQGQTVILENGFWSEEERSLYAMGGLEVGARIELYSLETPSIDALWERMQIRNASLTEPTWVMSREEVEAAVNCWQSPSEGEMGFYDEVRKISTF